MTGTLWSRDQSALGQKQNKTKNATKIHKYGFPVVVRYLSKQVSNDFMYERQNFRFRPQQSRLKVREPTSINLMENARKQESVIEIKQL